MSQQLKILVLEDQSHDAELVRMHLEELDYDIRYEVTASKKEYEQLLTSFRPHLVIADFTLPGYDGIKALRFLQENCENIPFVFFTGTLGEENAVKAIKAGASDFVPKEKGDQLPVAVLKALREREETRKRKAFERQLVAINALNSALLQHDKWEEALREAFVVIGDVLQVDRAYYFENRRDSKSGRETTTLRLEWTKGGTEPQLDNPEMHDLPFGAIPELIRPLREGKSFQAIVPEMALGSFKEILLDQAICSILVLPVFVNNRFHGFIGFDDCRQRREWSEDEHTFLDSLTTILSHAIERRTMLQNLKRSEKELIKTVRRLRNAQKLAKLGYWSKRFDSDLIEWTEEMYNIFGYSPENFTPTMENVVASFHPDDRPRIESDPRETLVDDKENHAEQRIITASGRIKWVDGRVNFIRDEEGMPLLLEGTIQDITDRKEREEELRISKERFELAMKAASEMIWDCDHGSEMVLRSTGYESTFGYKLREPAGKNNSWFSMIHPKDVDEVWFYIEECLSDASVERWQKEYRVIKPDGEIAHVIDRAHILRNEKGQPVRSVGAVLDITETRKQFRKIKAQNETLREIAWLQSHVLRAPLARIMGLIYLFQESNFGEKSPKEILDLITISAAELDEVVKTITQKTNSFQSS